MSTKRVLLIVLVASGVMLAAGGSTTFALPSAGMGLSVQGLSAVNAGGSPIGSPVNISQQTASNVQPIQPAVAYSSAREEYLVVWRNDRPGNDDIQARRVSKSVSEN